MSKFSDTITEAIYGWSLDGSGESAGSSDFKGWHHRTEVDLPLIVALSNDPEIDAEELKEFIAQDYATVIIVENNSGFVDRWSFHKNDLAQADAMMLEANQGECENGHVLAFYDDECEECMVRCPNGHIWVDDESSCEECDALLDSEEFSDES